MSPRREYNPRVRPLRTEPSLSPAVSSAQLYSFDEKRPDFVMEDRMAGTGYRQLAKALGTWDPVLQQYGQMVQEEDLAEGRTTTLRGENLDASGKPLTLETVAAWENDQGFFTGKSRAYIRGVKSVLYENAGVEYATQMYKYAAEGPLQNIEDPAERARLLQEKGRQLRQEFLDRIGPEGKDDYPLIDKYFNSLQTQTHAKLAETVAAQQARIYTEKAGQALRERLYTIFDTRLSPDDAARHMAGTRAIFTGMGLSEPEVNKLILQEAGHYLDAMNIGPNDLRGDNLIEALRRVPTSTGFLGQTAEAAAVLQQMQDRADARAERAETRLERQIKLQEAQEQRGVQQGIAAYLEADEAATYEDFQESNPELARSRYAREYFKKYQGYISDTQDRAETAANLGLTEELTIGLIRGTHTMDDVLENQNLLTRSQRKELIKKAETMQSQRDQINKLVGASRFNEVRKSIEEAQKIALKAGANGETPSLAQQALTTRKSIVAQNVFEAALYSEITRLIPNGVSGEELQRSIPDILERISAPLMDPNNEIVTKRAEEYMKGVNLSPLNPLLDDFALTYSGGKSPKPELVPPRILQYAEAAAQQTGVPMAAILAVSFAESRYDEAAQNGTTSAYGSMQLTKGTASDMGADPAKPDQNMTGGAKRLAQIAQMHNLDLTNPDQLAKAYLYYHDGPWHRGPHRPEAIAGAERVKAAYQATTRVEQAAGQQRLAAQQETERVQAIQQQQEAEQARLQAASAQDAQAEATRREAEEAPYIPILGPAAFSLDSLTNIAQALNSGEMIPILEKIQEEVPNADMDVVARVVARLYNELKNRQGPSPTFGPSENLITRTQEWVRSVRDAAEEIDIITPEDAARSLRDLSGGPAARYTPGSSH